MLASRRQMILALVLTGLYGCGSEHFNFGLGGEGRVFEVGTVGSDKVVRVRKVR